MFTVLNARQTETRRILICTALAIVFLALSLPSVSSDRSWREDFQCIAPLWTRGWELLLLGPMGVLDGQFGWIANPLMLYAALGKQPHTSIAALFAIVLIIVTAFSFNSIWMDGGGDATVCGFGPGYYLWLACSVLVLIATLLKQAKRYDPPKHQ